jgi:hypothetical protein
MSDTNSFSGQQLPTDIVDDYNNIYFIIKRQLARVRTATPVKVVSCSNSGGVSAIGTVVVQPLVNMLDGQGNSQAHGNINNIPYLRLQGGGNGAVISDPVAGDMGLLLVSDRDISAVQSSQAAANPGSYRRFDLADGIYIGCIFAKAPSVYIQFDGQGNININAGSNKVNITAQTVAITGDLTVSGNVTSDFGGGGSVDLLNHTHSGVTAGSDPTGPPTPGT